MRKNFVEQAKQADTEQLGFKLRQNLTCFELECLESGEKELPWNSESQMFFFNLGVLMERNRAEHAEQQKKEAAKKRTTKKAAANV